MKTENRYLWLRLLLAATAGNLAAAAPALASPLQNTPNIASPVVDAPGSLAFSLTHRMQGSLTSLSNTPTFFLSTSLLPSTAIDLVYATKATLLSPATVPLRGAHDFSVVLRQGLFREDQGAPLTATLHAGAETAGVLKAKDGSFSMATTLGGGGLTVSRSLGPITFLSRLNGAYFNEMTLQGAKLGAGGRIGLSVGANYAITPFLGLAADYGKYLDGISEIPAWGAALQAAIPYTPHKLSFEVTNVPTTTLGGVNQPDESILFWGFAFSGNFTTAERWLKIVTPTWLEPPAQAEDSPEAEPPAEESAAPAPESAPAPEPVAMVTSAPAQPVPAKPVPAAAPVTQAPAAAAAGQPVAAPPAEAPAAAPAPAQVVRAPAAPKAPKVIKVNIKDFLYKPANLTIPAGTIIEWTNLDEAAHTVTAENGSWDSKLFGLKEKRRITFAKVGKHPYICTPHPFMKGTITVTEVKPDAQP